MSFAIVRAAAQRVMSVSLPVGCRSLFGIKPTKYNPDPLELATGIEKKEMLARAAGNEDPFEIAAIKRGAGTRDQPTKIPSMEPHRLVGCICNEDALHISFTTLHMGIPKRCQCGHWYELIPGKGITHPSWIL